MGQKQWIKENTRSLANKLIAISGATGGLGKMLCRHLASLDASLILLDRNQSRSQALAEALKQEYPTLSVERIPLDLEDIDSVKAAAEKLLCYPLDALILNAGAYHIPRRKCKGGYDNVFMINFASPYYLAKKLKPLLDSRGGRLVAVGSVAHTYSVSDLDDFDFSTRQKHALCYGNAKRCLMFSLYHVYHGGSTLAITHPGITVTNITSHYPKLVYMLIKYPMKVIFMHPKKAALSILGGLFDHTDTAEWIGPRFFSVWGLPKKKALKSYDTEEASRIFQRAEAIFHELETLPREENT